jgi:hypothetical protein
MGAFERAPMLGGIAEALREDVGAPMAAPERERYDRFLALARPHLNTTLWNELWAEGRAMANDLDRVTAYVPEQFSKGTPKPNKPPHP